MLQKNIQKIGGLSYIKKTLNDAVLELKSIQNKNSVNAVIILTDGYFQDNVDLGIIQ